MKKEFKELCELFQKLTSANEVSVFLEHILTPKEIDQLTERWEILKRLHRGDSQRKISTDLAAGIMTVTRGASVLKSKSKLLTRLIEESEIF